MPWCPRCGTGLSQMEMNEGYQDREDPGLTVRFPLVDRPGEALLVWTTTPWTLTSNVAAAVGRGPALRPGPPGRGPRSGSARGRSRPPSRGRSRSRRRSPARRSSAGATPARSTTLPAVRDAFAEAGYEHRVVAWDEVGEDEGTGIVHIAPGCGAEDYQLGKAARAAGHRPDRRGRPLLRGLRLADRPRGARGRRADRRRPRAARVLLPPRAVQPPLPALLAVRDAAAVPPRRRVVHLDGRGLRRPARAADQGAGRREPALPDHGGRGRDPVDPGLRLRPGARLAPQHARLDDQQEALLGPGAADLRLRRVRDGRGHRRARGARASAPSRAGTRSRATRRTGRGSTRCGSRARRAARRSSGSRTSATRGSTPASCRSARCTSARTRTTGRSGSRPTSSPRASRASSATGSTRCSRCRPCSSGRSRSRRSSATPSCSARTGARCTRAGATRSSSTRRPTGWASTSCAGCSRRPGPRTTSCSAGTPPTRRAASCSSCGTCTRSSSPTRGSPRWTPRAGIDEAIEARGRRVAGPRPLDPVARGGARRGRRGAARRTSTRSAPRAR